MDSSHLDVLLEFDLAIFDDDPDSNNESLGLGLKVQEDGISRDIVVFEGASFDALVDLVEELVTCI
jgi:hypothetical protein